jgi:uncharacterized membrane protein
MVRNRIVFGKKSSKVREKSINEGSDLTLEKALDIARTYEFSQKQLQAMNIGEDPNVNSINRKKTYTRRTFSMYLNIHFCPFLLPIS